LFNEIKIKQKWVISMTLCVYDVYLVEKHSRYTALMGAADDSMNCRLVNSIWPDLNEMNIMLVYNPYALKTISTSSVNILGIKFWQNKPGACHRCCKQRFQESGWHVSTHRNGLGPEIAS
jgi:hypothetical protein